MSSNAYDTPLRLEWRESPWINRFTDLIHLLALAALAMPMELPGLWLGGLVMAVVASWLWQRFFASRRRQRLLRGCWVWQGGDYWQRIHGAETESLELRGPSVVLPWIISLCLRGEDGHYRFLLLSPDCLTAQTWRHMQVRLREWGRQRARDHAPT